MRGYILLMFVFLKETFCFQVITKCGWGGGRGAAFSPSSSHPLEARRISYQSNHLRMTSNNNDNSKNMKESDEKYRNKATEILANFMEKKQPQIDPLANIDFNAPKLSSQINLETLAAVLDAELYEKEWFVTGNVNPIYFSNDFKFQDPDVQIDGIEGKETVVCR